MKYTHHTKRGRVLAVPKRKSAAILGILAIGLLAFGLARLPAAPPITPKVEATDLTERASLRPKAPEHASSIRVDRLGVEVPIEQVGLTKKGSVASPADIKKLAGTTRVLPRVHPGQHSLSVTTARVLPLRNLKS